MNWGTVIPLIGNSAIDCSSVIGSKSRFHL